MSSLQDVFIQARKVFKKVMVNLINPFRLNKGQSWNNHKEIYCLLNPEILTVLYKRPAKEVSFEQLWFIGAGKTDRFPAKGSENKLMKAREGKQKK